MILVVKVAVHHLFFFKLFIIKSVFIEQFIGYRIAVLTWLTASGYEISWEK